MIFVINGYDFYTKSGFRGCFGLEIEDQRGKFLATRLEVIR